MKYGRIKKVLIDSNGYSTQAGVHAVSLTVVIYALLLEDDSNTILITSRVNLCPLFNYAVIYFSIP